MKIHIMGASCAGSTTLGMALGESLGIPYFDTDAYFWEPSDPAFTVRRDPELREAMLADALSKESSYIVGGSLLGWAGHWRSRFDLVVFLYVPKDVRLERLKEREIKRFGNRLLTDPMQEKRYRAFLKWASGYDDDTTAGRNLSAHRAWLSGLTCQVLEITGDTSVEERLQRVLPLV
jgi:adenylate kinase family enzyme